VSGIVGTGIGLYLVKMVIDLHQGGVAVESREGKGSRFTVRLPSALQREEAAPAAASAQSPNAVERQAAE
jgi:signal transduction histidine kinase